MSSLWDQFGTTHEAVVQTLVTMMAVKRRRLDEYGRRRVKIEKDGEDDGEEVVVVEGEEGGDEGGDDDDWRTACRYWCTTGVVRVRRGSQLQEIAKKSSEKMKEEEAARTTS
jgi:hypothetical protein